jgi:PAS domain-containing protein
MEGLQTLSDVSLAFGVVSLSKTYKSVVEIGRLMLQLGSDHMTECGYWIWDMKSDECYYSPKFIHTLGYDEKEIEYTGDTFRKLMDKESLASAWANTQELLAKGISATIVNSVKYVKKDGTTILFDCTVTTIAKDGLLSILFGLHKEKRDYGK